MKALERQSNYLHAHGSYIDDWVVKGERCFTRVMLLTCEVARHMIAEAIAQVNIDDYGALFGQDRDRIVARERAWAVDVQPWMLPGNKDFVLFRVSDFYRSEAKVYGIFQHDYRTYLIEGSVKLIRQYIEVAEGQDVGRPNKRLLAALDGNFTEDIPDFVIRTSSSRGGEG